MTSKIGETVAGGNWKHAHGTAHYGRNFSVKWLKVYLTSIKTVFLISDSHAVPVPHNATVRSQPFVKIHPDLLETIATGADCSWLLHKTTHEMLDVNHMSYLLQ